MSVETFIPEVWNAAIQEPYEKNLIFGQPSIASNAWMGEITGIGDTVHINYLSAPTVRDYTKGTPIEVEELSSTSTKLTIDQGKYFAFRVHDVDKVQAAGDFQGPATRKAGIELRDNTDTYLAGLLKDGALSANKIGTVGRPVNGYSVRINDDGEIEFAGPGVFSKYWCNEAATEEAVTDGWFNTGDLGEVDEDGFVSITGRKKDLIVTAGGKNISPGPMEEIIRQDPLISNALVVGDGKPFVGVLVTLDGEELKRWKANHNIPASKKVSELAQDPALRAEVQDAVNMANATVSRTEAIKKFRILDRDLSEQHDEMTPTMKVKRNVVFQRFQEDIDKLYQR